MKTIRILSAIAVIGGASLFSSCSESLNSDNSTLPDSTEKSAESVMEIADSCTFSGTLTDTEKVALMQMREEEKLARDVYLKFYEIYNYVPFRNIAKSENIHSRAVLYLINGYGLNDPALEDEGEFSTQEFIDLYKQLVDQGKESLVEALKVAAFIEEYDIADLLKFIEDSDNADIKRVFSNLLRGSEIHMRVYSFSLVRLKESYTPTIISAELYQNILEKNTNFTTTTGKGTCAFNYSFADVLTDAGKAGLIKMREEEKLAHDVYLFFYEKYNHAIFKNIAKAEVAHTKAVLWLLNGYGIEDPMVEGEGNFTNDAFTVLYKQLTEQGSASLEDALKVGAFIEEYDINDLINLLKNTESDNIARVYENLLKGSKFHIKAFTNILKFKGENYSPTILSEEVYHSILGK